MNHPPNGWSVCKLENIADDISYGYTAKSDSFSGDARMLRITDIQDGRVAWGKVPFCQIGSSELKKYELQNKDLVFARTGATVGKSYLVCNVPENVVFASYLIRVRLKDSGLSRYLSHFFGSYLYWGQISDFSAGIGQPNVNGSKLKNLVVPIAPEKEQQRIADKLDTVLTRVDACRDRLARVAPLLKRFRQSVLAAATSGRLTEDWRCKNRDATVDMGSAFESIKLRRGVGEYIDTRSDFLEVWQCPDSWLKLSAAHLLSIGFFSDIKDGNHGANHPLSSDFGIFGLPFLTAANVNDGKIDYVGAPKIHGNPLRRLKVGFSKIGDVILTHKGTVGRAAVATMDCVLSPQTTYYRVVNDKVLPKYLCFYLQSYPFQEQLRQIKSQTTRDFVPISQQYGLGILVPPRAEQEEIVQRVETLFAFADSLEARLKTAQAAADRLTPALLAKAFRGELVPQDPNDEPAAELLKRLATSRDAAPKAK